jgi:hypothetical protein
MRKSVVKKSFDFDDCSYQKFDMNQNGEDSSIPPWWSWEFMCGDFSICSCSQKSATLASDTTPRYEEMSFHDDDNTITSDTLTITSDSIEKGQ